MQGFQSVEKVVKNHFFEIADFAFHPLGSRAAKSEK